MRNRIRFHRRQRGMTLKELAERTGTTPQTISRLETEVMTVSVDWLERLGEALGVHPSMLIEGPEAPPITFAGNVLEGGLVRRGPRESEEFAFALPQAPSLAVKMTETAGPYLAGETLVCIRITGEGLGAALGHDCLVGLADGRAMLARVIKGNKESFTLVPLNSGGGVLYHQRLRWAAKVAMRLRSVAA
ncbi:MAG: helix-turn-helix transcriptional regulator [Alphaproteobacteria bacterium]|nr:helix-turn-helix transcriptional regulator [Alphaproteobacteria bacterium]